MLNNEDLSLRIQCGKCDEVWAEPLFGDSFRPELVGCRICPICKKETHIGRWLLHHKIYGCFRPTDLSNESCFADEYGKKEIEKFMFPKVDTRDKGASE